jgi:diacylglycerol kinase family enzyme
MQKSFCGLQFPGIYSMLDSECSITSNARMVQSKNIKLPETSINLMKSSERTNRNMGETRRFYFIFDQRAQKDAGLREGIDKLKSLGHSVSTKKIEEPDDAARFAGMAAEQKFDTVVAVGGDGMLNLVISGILHENTDAPCAVGLIPFGTANDFAGAGGIPPDNFLEALDIVIHAVPARIDVGQVNETFFVNVADGGFPKVSPSAVVNDGLLDLIIIPESEDGLIPLILEYSRMNHPDDAKRIIYRQVPGLNLNSSETIHLNLDGETVVGKNFRFKVHAQRLSFCLPSNSPILISTSAENKPHEEKKR